MNDFNSLISSKYLSEQDLAPVDDLNNGPVEAAAVEAPSDDLPRPGSGMKNVGMLLLGFILLLFGHLGANIVGITEIFCSDGPSILGFEDATTKWMVFGGLSMVAAAGYLIVGSCRFSAVCSVIYMICPIVGVAACIGSPIRCAKGKYVMPVCLCYLAIGSFVALLSAFYFYNNSGGKIDENFWLGPLLAGMGLQIGTAMTVGSFVKLFVSQDPEAEIASVGLAGAARR